MISSMTEKQTKIKAFMSQQWLFQNREQAEKEFYQKERALKEGVLVLIEQAVYHFENKKEWESQQAELLKNNPGQRFLTNLTYWHEWLRERDKMFFNSKWLGI